MKFSIKNKSNENIPNIMRMAGYHYYGKDNDELIFTRPAGQDAYPRFHVYLKEQNDKVHINIHLDQRKTVYKGSTAHKGEYEGELLEREAERIKQFYEQ